MGRWQRALVTGASSGIGEAFANQLAEAHVDVILVGRDTQALDVVASHARVNGVHVDVLQADLAVDEDVVRVVSVVRDCEPMVDLLVNNAGLGQWGQFVDLPIESAVDVMRVNTDALVRLTHAAALRMTAARRGAIIQISSTAAAAPGPQSAVYAATKAFVSSFGQAMSDELVASGVTCTTVLPGFTRTKYFERVGFLPDVADRHWMTADQVARIAIDAAREGRPLVVPGAINRWHVAIATPYPSLMKGRARRRVGDVLRFARRLGHRTVARPVHEMDGRASSPGSSSHVVSGAPDSNRSASSTPIITE